MAAEFFYKESKGVKTPSLRVRFVDNYQHMRSWEVVPTREEIRHQLKLMLSTRRFRQAPSQARFLKLVVDRALKNQTSSEIEIGPILFVRYMRDESTDVRVTASNLRKTINRYYSEEGEYQLVKIFITEPESNITHPEGGAYTPEFSYNSKHRTSVEFALGEFYLKRGMFDDCMRAQFHFFVTLQITPGHIGAQLGIAEAVCQSVMMWSAPSQHLRDNSDALKLVNNMLIELIEQAPRYWRVYAVCAWLLLITHQYGDAREVFAAALKYDRESTESFIPYLYLLWASGNKEDALRLSEKLINSQPVNFAAQVAFGMFLWDLRGHEYAIAALEKALDMEKGYYGLHYVLGRMFLALNNSSKAKHHLQRLRDLADDVTISRVESKWQVFLEILPPTQGADAFDDDNPQAIVLRELLKTTK